MFNRFKCRNILLNPGRIKPEVVAENLNCSGGFGFSYRSEQIRRSVCMLVPTKKSGSGWFIVNLIDNNREAGR